ncbi:MAG: hypothetical protein IJA10_05885 [Lachnospiraceae bacterium]|nr:hypothetical protein [Lachnospiraceae bacterium]
MGVRKKSRRKISVDDKEYIWYVEVDYDSPYHILNIVSNDKQLVLSCPIDTETPYLISKGKLFQNKDTNGNWNRYLLPFNIPEIVTPSFVAKIITWAMQDINTQIIAWNGKNIPI